MTSAERGEHTFPDTNLLFIGSVLVTSCYFSFATTALFWGLSTQPAATVSVATATRKARRAFDVCGKTYQLAYRFFGAVEVAAYDSRVTTAEPEKAIVDALDWPT